MASLPFSSLRPHNPNPNTFPHSPFISTTLNSQRKPQRQSFSCSFTIHNLSFQLKRIPIPIRPLSSLSDQFLTSEASPLVLGEADSEICFLDPAVSPDSIREWELDFCSRPILDIRGKKLWELVVCDSTLSLQFTKFFPNNVINSVTLKEAMVSISDTLGVPVPERIRFFRSQMQTIITKACTELGVKAIPSKRCISLYLWLEERYETVYQCHPGFQKGSKPLLALDKPFAMDLPDNLYGEKWAFVQLPFSELRKEILKLQKEFAFVGNLDLDLLGMEVEDNRLVPGLAVSSSRSRPLAAWINGLEVCSVEADTDQACLILCVGASTRYVYASYKKNSATSQEAQAWEAAKKACQGLHFLAIQDDLDSEDCAGFWLLIDLPPPPV